MKKLALFICLVLLATLPARANIFTNTFGGSPVSPSQVAYASYSLTGNLALFWPQFANGQTNVVATFMNVSASAGGFNLAMPDAMLSSVGYATIISNTGSNSFNVVTLNGSAIATIAAGRTYYIILSGNSTHDGTWQAFQFGTGTSSADASALAGAGLLASAGLLNVNFPGNVVNTNFSITGASRAVPYIWTGGSGTASLPTAVSVGSGFFFMLNDQGGGTVTVVPSGSDTIDGASSSVFSQTQSAFIVSTGSAWYTVGKGTQNTFAVTLLNLNVAGSSNITETSTQAQNIIQVYTGVLTGNINVVVPNTVQIYYTSNQTSGPYTLTLKTAAGTGIPVPQGQNIILYCDGTNVVNAYTAAVSGTFSLLNGTAASPSLSFQSSPSTGIYAPSAGTIGFSANAARSGQVEGDVSAVNYWRLIGADTGLPVQLAAGGSDSNVGIELLPKGNSGVGVGVAPSDKLDVAGAIGLTTTSTLPLNGLYLSVSNALSFSTSGVKSLTIGANQGLTLGAPTGGNEGSNTLNVAGNLYVNGSAVLTAVSPPVITLVGDVTGSSTSPITTTVAKIQGTVVSGTTGTTNAVFSTSPVLVTPTLGAASGTSLNLTVTGAVITNGLYYPAVNSLGLATSGVSALRITSTQSVGIGTTAPDQLLAVAGAIHSTTSGFEFPDSSFQLTHGIVSIHVQTFCASGCTATGGTYTPSAGLAYETVEMVAGGGGGAGNDGGSFAMSSGGGSGGYVKALLTAAQVGVSQAITLGAAGLGGASGANNGTGGATTSIGSLITCIGGSPGTQQDANSTLPGGAGGICTVTTGTALSPIANGQQGGFGGNQSLAIGGAGGSNPLGAGGPQVLANASTNGLPALGYGSGGSGGASLSGSVSGGDGKTGYVAITEYCTQ